METTILNKITSIEVTQEDIDCAGKDHTSCPIAKSIYRTHGIEVSVADVNIVATEDIENSQLWIRPLHTFPHIKCTGSIRKFIKHYDLKQTYYVKPTTFTIYRR